MSGRRSLRDKQASLPGSATPSLLDVVEHRSPSIGAPTPAVSVRGLVKLAEHSWDTSAVMGPDGRIVWVSSSIRRLLGYEPAEVVGMPAFDLIHPDDHDYATSELALTVSPDASRPAAFVRARHADGYWRHVGVVASDLSEDPDVRGILFSIRDVTQQVQAEHALRASERRFRSLATSSPIGIFQLDSDMNCVYVNDCWQEITGLRAADASGDGWWTVVHPDDVDVVRGQQDNVQRHVTRGRVRLLRPDGAERWAVFCTSPFVDEDGSAVGLVGTLDDVTELVAAQTGTRHLTTLLETTSDIVAIAHPTEGFTYLNRSARRAFGLDEGDNASQFNLGDHVPPWVTDAWSHEIEVVLRDDGIWSGELAIINAAGATLPVSTVLTTHCDAGGRIESVSGIIRDISERKAFEARLEHEATHDPLTGLPNRTLLIDRVDVALGRAERTHRTVAMFFLDIDHFKVVNDSLGHGLGDRLLVTVADRLSEGSRPGDTVARFGGDEFVVLCEDLENESEGRQIAERLLEAVSAPLIIDDREVFVTASLGIAFAGPGERSTDDLIRDADAAMYQAKHRGRARAEVFDLGMRVRAVDRLDLENALRRAIERQELKVLYQPQIALDSGRVVGVEALLRWEHPERGLLVPDDFLPIAEETGLIIGIGAWVLRQACDVGQRVADALPERPPLLVCVNLSARQLAHPELVAHVRTVLHETGINPALVDLEITENVLMDDVEVTQATLGRLKVLGVELAVDDFGTGYSSLSYLRRFPVDLLKVDRAFVDGLGRDPEDSAIVAAVVNLAHTLGLKAMAEGVETEDQLAELRSLGCDMAQGFLVARPLPEAELIHLLSTDPHW